MKNRLIRYNYNMVEVALALAILAIGISSILVLFPVGINASRSAIANNNLADIGEYIMSYLRAGCAAEWAKIAETQRDDAPTPIAPAPSDFFFSKEIPKGNSGVDNSADAMIDVTDSKYDGSSHKITENLSRLGTDNSAFLYRQMTGEIVDFAAVIKVWKEDYELIVHKVDTATPSPIDTATPSPTGTYPSKEKMFADPANANSISQYAIVLLVEVSWPAQAPYDKRETRLFRQEIFNEAYRKLN